MGWHQRFAFLVGIAVLLLTAIAAFCSTRGWAFRLEQLSHFQLQYWLLAASLTLVLLLLRQPKPLFVGLFCLTLLSTNILTWYIPSTGQTKPLVKTMFTNVLLVNRRYGDVIGAVRAEQPDLAGFTELDGPWVEQLDRLKDMFPYRTMHRDSTVLYSKINLAGTEIIDRDPRFPDTVVVRNLQKAGQKFTVVVTHPQSPRNLAAFQERNAFLERLATDLAKSRDNLIVMGDFNVSLWSPYYRKFVEKSRLINARQGFGVYPTWTTIKMRWLPAVLQSFLSIPIDHAFTRSGSVKLRATSFHTGPDVGSDHLPIVAEIGTVDS